MAVCLGLSRHDVSKRHPFISCQCSFTKVANLYHDDMALPVPEELM